MVVAGFRVEILPRQANALICERAADATDALIAEGLIESVPYDGFGFALPARGRAVPDFNLPQNPKNAGQGCGFPHGAFAYSDDGPSVAPQRLRHAPVAALVGLDFVAPEFCVGAGQVLAAASVPEAAVHENGNLTPRPCKIRLARNGPIEQEIALLHASAVLTERLQYISQSPGPLERNDVMGAGILHRAAIHVERNVISTEEAVRREKGREQMLSVIKNAEGFGLS
jgi:hypothetical protein